MLFVECKPDQTLAQAVTGLPTREIIHHQGKYRLMASLRRRRDTVAMVDEDPGSNQPRYLADIPVGGEVPDRGLRVLEDRTRGKRVVVLRPRLEEWLLRAAQEAGVAVSSPRYNLPDNARRLHQVITFDLGKVQRLVADLADSPRLRTLRELLGQGP